MRTLIVYASKYGATKKGAEYIAKGLKGDVQLISIKDMESIILDHYDKVVLGTPIYAGMINKEVKNFCENNRDILRAKKVALYFSCMEADKIDDYLKTNFKEEFIKNLVMVATCGGAFYFKKMNLFEKFIIKKIIEAKEKTKENPKKINTKVDIEAFDKVSMDNFIEILNQA